MNIYPEIKKIAALNEKITQLIRKLQIKIDADGLDHGFAPESVCGDILLNFLDNAPTIEAKPVAHAHWEIEYDDDDNIKKCYCSNCGVGCEPMNYCGFCGAQMDEKFVTDTNVGSKKE